MTVSICTPVEDVEPFTQIPQEHGDNSFYSVAMSSDLKGEQDA